MRGRSRAAPLELPLLSPHGHVLRVLLGAPETRQRELARLLGVTERSAARLIHELRSAGYLTVVRGGARRNHYTVRLHQPLTHRLERGHSVAEVLQLLPALDADPATS